MKPFDRLSDYLSALERRMRWLALSRGAAVSAAAALILTVLAVLAANQFAFSHPSVVGARVFLFLGLAFAIAAALIVPVIKLNRRRAASAAESKYPQFQERLLTFTERSEQNAGDPFLHLLAADTLNVAQDAQPHQVAKSAWIFSFSSAAVVSTLVLLWLGMSGPGFLGYGTGLLWGSVPKGVTKPFYTISVAPGNKTIRKRADQMIDAQLVGFSAPKVQFFAKYASASKWEAADMRTEQGGTAYQFLIAGVPETLDYYVEAGGVRSQTFKLNVIDLPTVKKLAVTFHYPAWLGLKDVTEDPGGDLRAVQGTVGEVTVTTDRPLASGEIVLEDGSKIALSKNENGTLSAKAPIEKDGMYHIAAVEGGEDVRLSEDYFIEAMKDNPPDVRITRPGHDFRASPIEEVTITVDAKDDFGLKEVQLHYSVNGGDEKVVPLLQAKNAKTSTGTTVIALEDFKVQPGDVVSLYATANDARSVSKTDMFFIEAQPFERNYTQSQQEAGGGGGGGGGDDNQQNQISQRQKEIITATWNQDKGQGARGSNAENAAFLSSVQSKLKDQAASLAQRMKSRELDSAGDSFKSFVADMEQAVAAMQPATDKLKIAKWHDALAPENKALQFLLRAEATFRDIQVAMGRQGGGGGGGGGGGMNGATRDLEGLFDLELDTQKNQYEGLQSNQSADAQQRQVDDALQKLQELAKRQQELAQQQKKGATATTQQRWEQEMLRREAEQLRQQLDQMNRNQQGQLSRDGQQSQQGQPGQQGQQGQPGQQGQQSGQSGQQGQPGQQGQQQSQSDQLGQMAQRGQQQGQPGQQQNAQQQQQNQRLRGADPKQLQRALESLQQAEQDMRQAAASQQQGGAQSDADARRAADRLNEASQMLSGMRNQQSTGQVDDLARQADELARKQQQFEGDLRHTYTQTQGNMTREQANQLADQHQAEVADVKKLEQGMQNAVRDLMATQKDTSTKVRQALSDMQQAEIARDMQRNADYIRRGMGEYAAMSESQLTAGLNQLRDKLDEVRKQMGQGGPGGKNDHAGQGDKALQDTLSSVEQLRQQVEARAAELRGQNGQGGRQLGQLARNGQQGGQPGQQGQQPGQQSQQGGQQPGQQGQQGGQPGQQGGQPGQQGGQQGGQQAGGGYNGGYNNGGDTYNGGYRGGPVRDQDIQTSYRNALQSLQQLQQQYRGDPNATRDINNLIRDFRQFDPYHLNNDPLLTQRIQAALGNIEQVEMELRRKVEQSGGDGSVRSPGSEPAPQGYSDAVAEYFRKLSKSKQ